ncbi:MAG: hypothetical protein RIR00_127, partial [Pseudomonadota bacterium]
NRQLQRLMEKLGLQVTVSADPVEALAAVEKSRALGYPFDFVLADAQMADPGGMAFAELWRRSSLPEKLIMMLTTDQQRQALARLRELQVGAHLIKPFSPAELLDALELVGDKPELTTSGFDLAPFEVGELVPEDSVMKILLVEDNPVNQELARRLLEKRHHEVVIANNGAEAVDLFEKERFDAILMDVQMPVMDGMEATEAIRAREMRRSWVMSDGFRPIYIIAMTANAMAGDKERCLDIGMDDYVSKPVRSDDLFAALERARAGVSLSVPAVETEGLDGPQVANIKAALETLGDRELLVQMAKMMLSEWDEYLGRIESSLAHRDGFALRMHAHTLKSLVAIFNAESSRAFAVELERGAEHIASIDWAHCREIANRLETEMARLRPVLEALVEQRAGV